MSDQIVQRAAVVFLGLVVLAVVIGGITLALDEHTLPDSLIAIGAGAAGALGGLVAASKSE